MGRIGTLQARWTTLSRLGRAGLVAAAVGVSAVLAGAAVDIEVDGDAVAVHGLPGGVGLLRE